jgi:hypothetical protein
MTLMKLVFILAFVFVGSVCAFTGNGFTALLALVCLIVVYFDGGRYGPDGHV